MPALLSGRASDNTHKNTPKHRHTHTHTHTRPHQEQQQTHISAAFTLLKDKEDKIKTFHSYFSLSCHNLCCGRNINLFTWLIYRGAQHNVTWIIFIFFFISACSGCCWQLLDTLRGGVSSRCLLLLETVVKKCFVQCVLLFASLGKKVLTLKVGVVEYKDLKNWKGVGPIPVLIGRAGGHIPDNFFNQWNTF